MDTQQAPQRFGRYVLLDRMGVGGMAEVFRAVVPGAEGFRRDLVVKRILTERARAANFIEMFVHEARISALLHHPNVVQVFDFGHVDGSYFLAMELLRGRDLLAVLRALSERQRPFPLPIAAHVAHQVALGLGYAHSLTSPDGNALNIIHRDVSPSNIMLLRTGGVKLLDFGIAQAIGEMDSDESERSTFKGKLSYMAPEQLKDEPQDHRVDLFALGAVMWEMLAGRRLFHGKTDVEKLRRVLDKPIPTPSSLRADVPPSLDRIVLKALARNPDDRYQTGEELADDLEENVLETKYHSRMMPALLTDLFGSAPSAAHFTMSNASPELFAFEPMHTPSLTPALSAPSMTPQGALALAPSPSGPGRMFQGARGLRRSTKLLVVAGMLASAGATAALTMRPLRVPHRMSSHLIEPRPSPAAPEVPSSGSTSPSVVTTPSTSAPTTVVGPRPGNLAAGQGPSPQPAAPVVRRAAPRPRLVAAKLAEQLRAGRISRGLSIDPFAEAATREPKR